jgi:hypothetical protein
MSLDVDMIAYLCGSVSTENNTLLFNNLLERQKNDLSGFFRALLMRPKTAKFIRKCIDNGVEFNAVSNENSWFLQ